MNAVQTTTAPAVNSRAEYQAARKAMQAERKKQGEAMQKKVANAQNEAEKAILAKIAELQPQAEKLRGSDSLGAVLIRRKLQAEIAKLRETVAVRNEQQKRDRGIVKAIRAVSSQRTTQELGKYTESLAKRALKLAKNPLTSAADYAKLEAAKLAASTDKLAAVAAAYTKPAATVPVVAAPVATETVAETAAPVAETVADKPAAVRVAAGEASPAATSKNNTRTSRKGATTPQLTGPKRNRKGTNSAQDLAAVTAPNVLGTRTQEYAG